MPSVHRRASYFLPLLILASVVPSFAQQPVINGARVADGTLSVLGANFGTKPTVVLAGTTLSGVSVSSDGTQITASVPALDAGSYTLIVSVGKRQVSSVVTVGAVGTPGPAGPPGSPGAEGAPGPGALLVIDANDVVLGSYLYTEQRDYLARPFDGFVVLFGLQGDDFWDQGNTVVFWHTTSDCSGVRYIATSTSRMMREAQIRGRAAVWATTQVAPIVPHSNTQCQNGADILTGVGCFCDTGAQPNSISSIHLASEVLDLSAAVPPFRIK